MNPAKQLRSWRSRAVRLRQATSEPCAGILSADDPRNEGQAACGGSCPWRLLCLIRRPYSLSHGSGWRFAFRKIQRTGSRLRAQLNLYKPAEWAQHHRSDRQLDFLPAPTTRRAVCPRFPLTVDLRCQGSSRIVPTEFRYPVLLERARRQIQVAAQFES